MPVDSIDFPPVFRDFPPMVVGGMKLIWVSIVMGVPPVLLHLLFMALSNINHSAIGLPHDYGNLHVAKKDDSVIVYSIDICLI